MTCPSKALPCADVESGVKTKIRNSLESPVVYLMEAQERIGITEHTIADLEQSIRDLETRYRKTIEDERRALRLLSDEAFRQEQHLITASRTWVKEEIERLKEKLRTFQRFAFDSETIETMRARLGRNLSRATDEDWSVILQALDAKVIAFGDGTWDIEVKIQVESAPIENRTP